MDTFMDSSWYWFRYLSPHKDDGPIDTAMVARWTPVDQYTGGAEHAVMHLLYAREITKMMRDVGLVEQGEPFLRLFNQGQILGADGERMSKSRGNVQDPDDLVARYGADTIRLFLMFMGPWDQGGPWSSTGIGGVHRFLNRVWTLALDPAGLEGGDPDSGKLPAGEDAAAAERSIRMAAHRTLRVVADEYEGFRFNTMVAHLMELANTPLPLPRHRSRRRPRLGRGDPAAPPDARARRAPHQRRAMEPPPGRLGRPPVARSTRESWPAVDELATPPRRARSRSR